MVCGLELLTVDWKTAYRSPFLCTKISKLLVLQFELLHRRLATNTFLEKINLKDNDPCSVCQIEEETLIHLLWNCTVTPCFWHNLRQWLHNNGTSLRSLELTPSLAIGLTLHPFRNKYLYFLLLVARFYIWTCKTPCFRPMIENFPNFLSKYNLLYGLCTFLFLPVAGGPRV